MSNARERFEARRHMSRHLSELQQLVGRPVHSSDLLSLEETRRVVIS